MSFRTYYRAQPYWLNGRRLTPGFAEQYATRHEAERAAARLYANHAGVHVFSISGNPEYDYWRDPRVVAAIGLVP